MLLDEIKQGESKVLEFKEQLPYNSKNYLKTIIAFSNGNGGKLIIGVRDKTGEIVGIPDYEDELLLIDKIANAIADACEPQIIPNIYPTPINGKTLIVIEVVAGILKPYFLKNTGKEDGTYIRIGTTSHPADRILLSELEYMRKNISFDALPCPNFPINEDIIEKMCKLIYLSKKRKSTTSKYY